MNIEQLKSTAEYYCDLYRLGKISREKAKENIMPYLDYEYTRAYRSFCEKMDKKYGSYSKYLAKNADKSEVLMLANGLVR